MMKNFLLIIIYFLILNLNVEFCRAEKVLKESRRMDNIYEYFYKLDKSVSDKHREKIQWVFNYLSLGSNIIFLPAPDWGTKYITFTYDARCGFTKARIAIGESCETTRDLVNRVLYTIGVVPQIIFDLQNVGKTNYAVQSFLNSRRFRNYISSRVLSGIDRESVTYDYSAEPYLFELYNDGIIPAAVPGRDRFQLSNCDWSTLCLMYPGSKSPPPCNKVFALDSLVPTDAFIERVGADVAREKCEWTPTLPFENGDCVFENGRRYPTLPWVNELHSPSGAISPIVMESYCSLYKGFKSIDEYDCYKGCTVDCPQKFPQQTLLFCMKYRFLKCNWRASRAKRFYEPKSST